MKLTSTDKLQLVLDGSSVAPIKVVASFSDHLAETTYDGDNQFTDSDGTTPVDIVSAPSVTGQVRTITALSVYQPNSAAATVTILVDDGTNTWNIVAISLSQGDCLQYSNHAGWQTIDANGNKKVIYGATATGFLAIANNLSDLASASAARGNLGLAIGTDVQAYDATLAALAAANWAANSFPIGSGSDALSQVAFAANTFPARASTGNLVAKTITDFALTILDDTDATTVRSTLGLGTAAVVNTGTSGGTVPVLNANNTWSGVNYHSQNGIANTSTDVVAFQNTTVSTSVIPVQYSPRALWTAHVWNTTTTAADNLVQAGIELRPVSGASPYGILAFAMKTSVSGASLVDVMTISNAGGFTTVDFINGNYATLNNVNQLNGKGSLPFDVRVSGAGAYLRLQNITQSGSSGTDYGVQITPTYAQSSTAGATDLLVNRTQTSVGSGAQRLLDLQVGGSSKFNVDNTGAATVAGYVDTKQGGSTSFMRLGGRMKGLPNITPVGNVGAGEDDLMTLSIPANTFAANGDTIVWKTRHDISATSNLRWWFAGNAISVDGGGSTVTFNSGGVEAEIVITRLDFDSVILQLRRSSSTADSSGDGVFAEAGPCQQIDSLTFSGAITIKTTGEGTSTNDIVQRLNDAHFIPANP